MNLIQYFNQKLNINKSTARTHYQFSNENEKKKKKIGYSLFSFLFFLSPHFFSRTTIQHHYITSNKLTPSSCRPKDGIFFLNMVEGVKFMVSRKDLQNLIYLHHLWMFAWWCHKACALIFSSSRSVQEFYLFAEERIMGWRVCVVEVWFKGNIFISLVL